MPLWDVCFRGAHFILFLVLVLWSECVYDITFHFLLQNSHSSIRHPPPASSSSRLFCIFSPSPFEYHFGQRKRSTPRRNQIHPSPTKASQSASAVSQLSPQDTTQESQPPTMASQGYSPYAYLSGTQSQQPTPPPRPSSSSSSSASYESQGSHLVTRPFASILQLGDALLMHTFCMCLPRRNISLTWFVLLGSL